MSVNRQIVFNILEENLNPRIENIILCQNTVDMMRYRILLHEHLGPGKKTLLNTSLFTPRLWFRKTLFDYPGSENVIVKENVYKAILLHLLNDEGFLPEIKDLHEIISLRGFTGELLNLWHSYLWYSKTNEIFTKPGRANSGAFTDIQKIFNAMEQTVKRSGLTSLPHYIETYDRQETAPGAKEITRKVLYLFPSHLTIVEKKIITFLAKALTNTEWIIFTRPDSFGVESINEFFNGEILPRAPLQTVNAVGPKKPLFSFEFNRNTAGQDGNDETVRLFANKTETTMDEAALVAGSIRRLFNGKVPAHEIMTLYTHPSQAMALQFALSKLNIALDCPEGVLALSSPVFSILFSLLKIYNSSGSGILPGEFSDFITNPLCDIRSFLKNESPGFDADFVSAYIKKNIQPDKITLPLLARSLAGSQAKTGDAKILNEKQKSSLQTAARLALKLEEERLGIPKKSSPSKIMELFSGFTAKYIEIGGNEIFQKQFEKAGKLLSDSANLDPVFPEGIYSASLFRLLEDEINSLTIPLELPGSVIENNSAKSWGRVSARSIQEGLSSPVQHLFVMGLNASAFPIHFQNSGLAQGPAARKYILQRTYNQQKELFFNSLHMAGSGVSLSYSLDQDASPSPVFIEFLRKAGEKGSADEIAEKLSLYKPEPGFFRNAQHDSPSRNFKEPLSAKFQSMNSGSYMPYFGHIQSVRPGSAPKSAGALEELAACPQRYWFHRILKLEDIEELDADQPLDFLDRGNLFHNSARNFIQSILKEYPGVEYKALLKTAGKKTIQTLLSSSFENAVKSFNAGETLFLDSQKNSLETMFYDYFNRFLKTCEQSHPLGSYMPIAAEWPFKNLQFGSFNLEGRIDRIDYSKDSKTLLVIDYKTGNQKTAYVNEDNIQSLIYAQLPVYIKAVASNLEQLELSRFTGKPAPEEIQAGGAYVFALRAAPPKEILFLKNRYALPLALTTRYLHEFAGALGALEDIMSNGSFFSAPVKQPQASGRWLGPCSYCEYAKICDRNPYDLNIARLNDSEISKYKQSIHEKKKY